MSEHLAPRVRRLLGRLAVLGVCLLGFTARAEPWPKAELPLNLPRNLIIDATRSQRSSRLFVKRGSVSAPLLKIDFDSVYLSPNGQKIEVRPQDDWYFGEPLVTRFALEMLEARLENATALELHRGRRYKEAALGFRKALLLDPRFILAAYNLASALGQQGKKDEAVAALAPFLRNETARVYLAMLQDPELLPLMDAPALAVLRAQPPGQPGLKDRNPSWTALSAKHNLLALLDDHSGLVVLSLRTGQRVAQLDMGSEIFPWSCDGCGDWLDAEAKKAKQSARVVWNRQLPLAKRFLSELGFSEVLQGEHGKLCEPRPSICFQKSGLRLAFGEDGVKIYGKGNTLLKVVANDGSNSLDAGTYLSSAKALFYHWSRRHGATDRGAQAGTELILLSPGPVTPRSHCELTDQYIDCGQ